MNNDLLSNLERIHTTPLGVERIKKNLNLEIPDVVAWCKERILNANDILQQGKNWYVGVGNVRITINAHSFTIITAHKVK